MRVGWDASAAVVPRPTGVAKAILGFAQAAAALPGLDPRLYYRASRWRKRAWLPEVKGLPRSWFMGPFIRGHGIQLFHGLDTRLPWRLPGGVRSVATIHDFSALQEQGFSRPSFTETRKRHYEQARGANRIMVYTKAIAIEASQRLSLPVERFGVVPLAPALPKAKAQSLEQVTQEIGDRPYILVLGEVSRRKNTRFALEAFALAKERWKIEASLVLVGRRGFGAEDCEPLLGEGVRCLDYLDDGRLAAWLEKACCLFFPTRYEGFGLPVLEAMRVGVPVLAGSCEAVTEVSGEAACLIDPDDVEAAALALRRVLEDEAYSESLASSGCERSQEFSWEKSASSLKRLYEEVLSA